MRRLSWCLLSAILIAALGATTRVGASGPYEPRRSEGPVAFELTPREPAEGRFTVDIRADTHDEDLADLDLSEIVLLEAAAATYRPVAVQRLGGHHASGWVTFEIGELPEHFAVTMTGVPDVGDLRFEWP